jgi:iron complex transport system substrate-binding protein
VSLITLMAISVLAAQRIPIRADWQNSSVETSPSQSPARRVVSLISAADEILVDLGAEDRVIALSIFADDPDVSNIIHRAGIIEGRVRANAEEIIPLEPDLVIASAFNRPETLALLAHADVPIARLVPPSNLEGVRATLRRIGSLMRAEARAELLVRRLDATLLEAARLAERRPAVRALLYSASGYTAGEGTLFDELLRLAGGINVASELGVVGHAPIALEQVLSADPTVIFTQEYRADARGRDVLEGGAAARYPAAWDRLSAVQNARVINLHSKHILSTTHYVAEAAVAMANALHSQGAASE